MNLVIPILSYILVALMVIGLLAFLTVRALRSLRNSNSSDGSNGKTSSNSRGYHDCLERGCEGAVTPPLDLDECDQGSECVGHFEGNFEHYYGKRPQ